MTDSAAVGGATAADLLVVGGDVVTMDSARRVITGATIVIAGGRIAGIGSGDAMRTRFPGTPELDARGCVVVPGLINAHQHTTADPLVRSMIPDSIGAQEAIFEWMVPLHERVGGGDDELSAMLTAVDSVTRGVTTVLEAGTVAHPLRVAAGLRAVGVRGRVGRWGWDAAGVPFSAPAAESLAWQEETVRALARGGSPGGGLVSGWVTLVGHDLVSDELFAGAVELADRLDVQVTWHISPGENDVHAFAKRSGLRPVVHLRRLGVLGPRVLLGHAVWLDDAEVEAILESGAAVASCPAAYLRLGQGYLRAGRHVELVRRGGRLALGCDAHNAGDAPDVLRAAWLLAAADRDAGGGDPFRADEAFAVATIGGAQAIDMDGLIGSVEVGKAADLVVLDGGDIGWIPRGDVALQLVWGAASSTVRDVVIDGRVVVRDRRVTTVDVQALRQEAEQRSAALLRRAGIDVPHRWTAVAAESYA